jgi:hypothetical protein
MTEWKKPVPSTKRRHADSAPSSFALPSRNGVAVCRASVSVVAVGCNGDMHRPPRLGGGRSVRADGQQACSRRRTSATGRTGVVDGERTNACWTTTRSTTEGRARDDDDGRERSDNRDGDLARRAPRPYLPKSSLANRAKPWNHATSPSLLCTAWAM